MRVGGRGTRGVTVVEAAFALPILLMVIFGLIDLGMWTFNGNQATNAARDGARLAILDYRDADDEGSAMHTAIVDAVRSRLEDDKVEAVTVGCLDDAGADIDCTNARMDIDSVRVEVAWTWQLVTPIAVILGHEEGAATGSATMRLVGRPLAGSPPTSTTSTTSTTASTTTTTTSPTPTSSTTTTAPPAACSVSTLKAPTSVNRKQMNGNRSSQLAVAVPVDFSTNGSSACSDLRVRLVSPSGEHVEIGCGCDLDPPEPPDHAWSYDGSDNIWRPGTAVVQVRNGTTVLATRNFTVN